MRVEQISPDGLSSFIGTKINSLTWRGFQAISIIILKNIWKIKNNIRIFV